MAATNIGQWELVVKGSKKKNVSVPNGRLSKNEKKQFLENAPKMTKYGIVSNSDSGDEKENKQPKPMEPAPQIQVKKKKNNDKKKEDIVKRPADLKEAISSITVLDVKELVNVVATRYKDSPLIWLKDLSAYLNVRINPVITKDPSIKSMSSNYLSELLDPDVKKLFFSTFKSCSNSVLASFHHHCVTSMVHEIPKGFCVFGYKLILQLLAECNPEICVSHLDDYCRLQTNYQNQPQVILSLFGAIGGAGKKDFRLALKIWLKLMFPFIGLKNYSAYTIEYGNIMFANRTIQGDYSDILSVHAFFSIFDFAWTSSSNMPKHLQKDIASLYEKMKSITLDSNKDLQSFFPSFLHRLETGLSDPLKSEILSNLSKCLLEEKECWNVWTEIYLKYIPQSSILIKFINESWPNSSYQSLFFKPDVKKTIYGIEEANSKIEHKIHAVKGLRDSIEETRKLSNLLRKLNKSSRILNFKMLFFLIIVAFVVWDYKKSSSFKKSHIGVTIDSLGLTSYVDAAAKSTKKALQIAFKWCNVNIPIYYSKGCELAGPYLLLFWEKFNVISKALYENIVNITNNVQTNIPTLLQKLDKAIPGSLEALNNFLSKSSELVVYYYMELLKLSSPVLNTVHQFFITRVFVGPLEPQLIYSHLMNATRSANEIILGLYSSAMETLKEK